MKLRCPLCGGPLDADALSCAQGHPIERGPGQVIRLMTPDFATEVDRFEAALADFRGRAGLTRLEPGDYSDLPARPAARGIQAWVARAADLALIQGHIAGRSGLRVLDLGGWNGWLSEALSRRGHTVTAVSYFGGSDDGLGARARYPAPAWTAIQMDERRLDLIDDAFDLVVVNLCLHASPDPVRTLGDALAHLSADGMVIATGLPVFGDPRHQAARFSRTAAEFESRYGLPYRLVPGRDWLDRAEVASLIRAGARIRRYPGGRMREILALLRPATGTMRYLIARRPISP